MSTIDKVERVVAPVVESAGLELVDLELRPGGVKVTVDRPGGVDLNSVGSITAAISRALDVSDPVPGGSYELEVSSPGVERRLRRPEHFQRHLGAQISVKTKPGSDGERRVEGLLTYADESHFRLEGDGVPGGVRELGYAEVERAHTIFDWRAALAGTSAPHGRREHKHARKNEGRRREGDDKGQGNRR